MDGEMKYSLSIRKVLKYGMLLGPVFMLAGMALFVFSIGQSNTGSKYSYLGGLPLLALVVWSFWKNLRRPMKIQVYESYAIFINFFGRRIKVLFSDMQELKTKSSGELILQTVSGQKFPVNGFNEFGKFLEDIRLANPGLTVKGL